LTFAPGDKVMQIENDYDKEVYNATSLHRHIDLAASELAVSFDGRSVNYGFGELDTLVPAFAVTIHKSQGSEYRRPSFRHDPALRHALTESALHDITRAGSWSCWSARRRLSQSRFETSRDGALVKTE